MAILAIIVSCEFNPDFDAGNGPTVISGGNIEFGSIDPTWTQEEVVAKVKLVLSQLAAQSQTLRSQYTDWETQLRAEISTSYNTELVLSQIGFASNIKTIEGVLYDRYQRSNNISYLKIGSENSLASLADAIGGMFLTPNSRELFEARVQAFQMAHYMDTRAYLTDAEKAAKQDEFAAVSTLIEQLGGGRISQNSMYSAIFTLKTNLTASIPQEAGPNRNGFIQQFEDYAQFDGWTEDLKALWYNLNNLPRSVSREVHNGRSFYDKQKDFK